MDTSHENHPTSQEQIFFDLKALGTRRTREVRRTEKIHEATVPESDIIQDIMERCKEEHKV